MAEALADADNARSGAGFLLGEHGPFAEGLPQFQSRAQQQALANAIERAFAEKNSLIGEAGTGVGKTFAYLVPALLSREQTVISTGTKHLQDQLYRTDLPAVKRILGLQGKTALLKGRSSYLCRERLKQAQSAHLDLPGLGASQSSSQLRHIVEWAARTRTGDISEVHQVPETSPIWRLVTSDVDFCTDHEFEALDDCFVQRARRRAQDADLIVVNHHLLVADLVIRERGFGELLPSASQFIIDEAHQLYDVLANFFGKRLTSRQITDLISDCETNAAKTPAVRASIQSALQELAAAAAAFRESLGPDSRREAWAEALRQPTIERAMFALARSASGLQQSLEEVESADDDLGACARRSAALTQILQEFALSNSDNQDHVNWFEATKSGFSLERTPLDVANSFQEAVAPLRATFVFTSATLSVDRSFSHFRGQLGLKDAHECIQDSPFNYAENAMLYVPHDLVDPRHRNHTQVFIERLLPVLEASGGRAFILFTSLRALREAEQLLQSRTNFALLVQGRAPKHELLEQFKVTERAVLLGAASFWEGVDVQGPALCCVAIDKLPFAPPNDPVVRARTDNIARSGGDAFSEFQLPRAAIALQQGVGRLIRSDQDRGVVMLGDSRVVTHRYGETLVRSLPPLRRTRDQTIITNFLQHC